MSVGRKTIMRRMPYFLVILICSCSLLTGCATKGSKIKDTLTEFQYACQNLDLNAMLNCIDPDIADPIRLGLIVYGAVTEQDYEDVVDSLFDSVLGDLRYEIQDSEGFLQTMTVTDTKLKAKRHTAVVTCTLNFEISGQEFHRRCKINMVEREKKWYISGFSFASDSEND